MSEANERLEDGGGVRAFSNTALICRGSGVEGGCVKGGWVCFASWVSETAARTARRAKVQGMRVVGGSLCRVGVVGGGGSLINGEHTG